MYARTSARLSAAWAGALVLAGCAGPDTSYPAPAVEALASPAGEGSGEPFVSSTGDAVLMSWLEASAGGHVLKLARLEDGAWSEARVVAEGDGFFVNWADFPSVTAGPDGTVWAHWLVRGPKGGYDYSVRVASSADGGRTWSEPWTLHDDRSPTEHGFVSIFPLGARVGFAWLDGSNFAPDAGGEPPTREMTLRFRSVDRHGSGGPERLLDGRICDCCQTDAAVSAAGPVVVYRDRSPDEIRDIYITRYVGGAWTEGAPVHSDGWHIAGCPVNGPAVAARGSDVAVAWFTGAENVPRVYVAYSRDGGATFAAPHRVDDGNPGGRVDVSLDADGIALVTWLERTGGEDAEIRAKRIDRAGRASPSATVASSSAARASGFPRMAEAADGRFVLAWTDATSGRVRVAALTLGEH